MRSLLHIFSLAFGVVAAGCLGVAIAGMVTGRPGVRGGTVLRLAAVASFVAAVVLNVLAH